MKVIFFWEFQYSHLYSLCYELLNQRTFVHAVLQWYVMWMKTQTVCLHMPSTLSTFQLHLQPCLSWLLMVKALSQQLYGQKAFILKGQSGRRQNKMVIAQTCHFFLKVCFKVGFGKDLEGFQRGHRGIWLSSGFVWKMLFSGDWHWFVLVHIPLTSLSTNPCTLHWLVAFFSPCCKLLDLFLTTSLQEYILPFSLGCLHVTIGSFFAFAIIFIFIHRKHVALFRTDGWFHLTLGSD